MAYGNPPRRLYVLELSDGIVKAGITRGDAMERIRQHKAANPGAVVRHYIGERYVTGIGAENALLDRMAAVGQLARGREWFSGVTFDQATEFVRQVTEQFVHPDPDPQPSPKLRKGRGNISLNDRERGVLDAYCALKGKEPAVACRELLLEGIAEFLQRDPAAAASVSAYLEAHGLKHVHASPATPHNVHAEG